MIPRELLVLHVAILSQVLQFYIAQMKANNWFTGVFKNFVSNFLKQFQKLESKYFDEYFKHKEEETLVLYDTYEKYIQKVAEVPLWEMKNVTDLIDAYLLDQKSMIGIAKKVHKNHKENEISSETI